MFAWLRTFVWLWLLVAAGALPLGAATKPEEKAFQEATLSYNGRDWARAERELGAFVVRFPGSEFRAEALLFQAESRIKLGNFAGAIELLESGRDAAGRFADEYLFWLAEAQFQGGQIKAAAESYARFVNDFTNSARALDATVAEAAARSRLRQWPRVVELLANPEGRFQTLANASPGLETSVRGRFLLAEALVAQKKFEAAAGALGPLVSQPLEARLAWQRDYLRARVFLAQKQPEAALALATNLTNTAGNVTALRAEGTALQARIHEQLGQSQAAIAAWRLNLDPQIPQERQREALLRVGDLLIRQGRLAEATQTLDSFLTGDTNVVAADVINLTLGELRLRSALSTNGPAATNLLSSALEAFENVLRDFPASDVIGRASLGQGWCFWMTERMPEGAAAFQVATGKLSDPFDQSVARFKLADAQARQGDFAGALTNYQQVVVAGTTNAQVRSNLVERSLYQVLRAAQALKNDDAANAAMSRLLEEFPGGSLLEPALVLFGRQGETRANPAERRQVLEEFLKRAPDSTLAAGVQLAIGRTLEQEQNWSAAAQTYKSWLDSFPNDPARPRTEYLLALATARSGNESAALNLFTNYVAQYAATEFAPLARWWTADYYWQQDDFINAEANYQLVFQNHPESDLRYEAQLMAGRAALARGALREAIGYFTNLVNDPSRPPVAEAQALFAYGDTLMSAGDFDTAIAAFSRVAQLYSTSRIAVLAQVKIGNCYLQLSGLDATNALARYHSASNAYQRVLTATNHVEFTDRAEAEVGLGLVLERQASLVNGTNGPALQRAAMDHYLNVIYGSARRDDEPTDMFWVKRAGLEHALPLAETMQRWDQVARLCETLAAQLPPLQAQLDKRRARAEEQARKTPN